MVSTAERFWITWILRLAFGFLFLFASINIFSTGGPHDFGPDWFAKNLSKGFGKTWLGQILPEVEITVHSQKPVKTVAAQGAEAPAGAGGGAGQKAAAPVAPETEKVLPTYFFLYALPFVFAGLSLPILCGIFLRPALRAGAILLVMLGLGKYVVASYANPSEPLATTAHDFFFAFLICVGLYFLGQEKREKAEAAATALHLPPPGP